MLMLLPNSALMADRANHRQSGEGVRALPNHVPRCGAVPHLHYLCAHCQGTRLLLPYLIGLRAHALWVCTDYVLMCYWVVLYVCGWCADGESQKGDPNEHKSLGNQQLSSVLPCMG